ncbi:MAG: T9SS type A sorting domain-containing protein [Ignavibacteriae bacterium]|nr:T9SS type A sorting domain-containing protein [Ignavibacteriota bacterium]
MKRIAIIIIFFMLYFVIGSVSNEILIKEIASKVNIENIEQIIKDLSGENTVIVDGQEIKFINRYYKSDLNKLAAKYITNKLAEYGYDAHFVSVFPSNWTVSLETSYAIKPGRTKPQNVVLFSANFDTRYSLMVDPLTDTLPGANLNATGIAIMLEAARILKSYENEKTIVFAGFDDVYDSGYGPGHLLDSLNKSDIEFQENIFLTGLGRELFQNENTFFTSDTVKASHLVSTFKFSTEVLNLNTFKNNTVKGFATLRSQLPHVSDLTFTNSYRAIDSIASGINDKFENLNLDYLYDNSKIAISSLSVLAEVISKNTSVNSKEATELGIYPNPASDFITISIPEINPTVNRRVDGLVDKVQIFDMLGIEVISTPSAALTPTGEGNLRIDVSHLPAGVYFIRIGTRVEKFVKM